MNLFLVQTGCGLTQTFWLLAMLQNLHILFCPHRCADYPSCTLSWILALEMGSDETVAVRVQYFIQSIQAVQIGWFRSALNTNFITIKSL